LRCVIGLLCPLLVHAGAGLVGGGELWLGGGGQGDTLIWEDNMAGDPMGKAEAGELELNHGDANNGYEMKKKEKDLRTWI